MTLELHDNDSFSGTIVNTESEQLSVKTSKADYVELLVDDGTTGTSPGSYDLVVEYYSTAVDDWMQVDTLTGVTTLSPSVVESARGQKYRVTVTNSSGSDGSYRVSLEAYTEI